MEKLGKLFDSAAQVESEGQGVLIKQYATDIAQIADSNFWLAQQSGSRDEIAAAIRNGRMAAEALEKIAAAHRQYYESMESYLSSDVQLGRKALENSAKGMLDVSQIYRTVASNIAASPYIDRAMLKIGQSHAAVAHRVQSLSTEVRDRAEMVRAYIDQAASEAARIGHEISEMPQRIAEMAGQIKGDIAKAATTVFASAKAWVSGKRAALERRIENTVEAVNNKVDIAGRRLMDLANMGQAAFAAAGSLATEVKERFQAHYQQEIDKRKPVPATDVQALRVRLGEGQLNDEEAWSIHQGGAWRQMSPSELVAAQLAQENLFCDPDHFVQTLDAVMGRVVDVAELREPNVLVKELLSKQPALAQPAATSKLQSSGMGM